ncbi:MAG TPA: DUF192 domain-containing protein [Stellaceae bacterium]|nr:DUF192 domain-containing protein [Stellaceae bacterium]
MAIRHRLLLVIALIAPLWATVPAAAFETFATAQLTIVSASGPHKFTVELATTPAQQAQGLMFRRSLAPDAGMLFDFGTPTTVSFWMKNTLIPLDMLFVAQDGRIVGIHARAVPELTDPIPSPGLVRAVIEVNGGTADRLGIKPGDRVIYPIFGARG